MGVVSGCGQQEVGVALSTIVIHTFNQVKSMDDNRLFPHKRKYFRNVIIRVD